MFNTDKNPTLNEIREKLQQAIAANDTAAFANAFEQRITMIADDLRAEFESDGEAKQTANVLMARGVRQLTPKETSYYQDLAAAFNSRNPKQAIANMDKVMPETVINSVFDELQTRHPLLSKINFQPTGVNGKVIVNTNGYEKAAWGELCDEIVKELTSGFKAVDAGLLKLSAFLPVCKQALSMGPQWLDRFVRQVLYEALANGLEAGYVNGTGNEEPIGMTRQVGAGVTVTGGVYPKKEAITVNDFSAATVGNLVSLMATDANGKPRIVRDLILLVNPQDYFAKVMPATTAMAPDGTYRNNIMPYPMEIIQEPALSRGEAVIGIAYRYLGTVGVNTSADGQIEYSDHAKFLEDQRVYIIKAFANGMPMDNNAFLVLDISGLQPLTYKVEQITPRTPSSDATLASLSLGTAALTPAFAAATTTYTATTTNATNTVNAVPADAGATIVITLNDEEIENGSAAEWETGENTLEIEVTAEDGTTTKTYTVTVTKS